MLTRTSATLLLILVACASCFAQKPYKGLTAGRSAEADVERVLGRPLKRHSETLVEYGSSPDVLKVYVQYRKDSPVADRIEVLTAATRERAEIIAGLKLSETSSRTRVNDKGRLEEYFGTPAFIILTYEGEDAGSGVARVGHYSQDLFKHAAGEASAETVAGAAPQRAGVAAAEASQSPPGVLWQVCEYAGGLSDHPEGGLLGLEAPA